MDAYGGELWSGATDSWECDANGHLNVRFHIAKQMDALAGLAHEIGMPGAFAPSAEATLVVRDHYIRFLKEARPPDNLYVTGGVVEMGETDARVLMIMRHVSGEIAAIIQMIVEHVTVRDLRPFPWPPRVRERVGAWTIAMPPEMAPRTLSFDPVESQASLSQAEALGLARGSFGVVNARDCDAFGRLRTEMFISRLTNGLQRIGARDSTGSFRRDREEGAPRIGGAALEYRLIYLAWPRPGDRIEMRGGLAGNDNRFRRLVNWLVDPGTGKPWATTQALLATFDMDTRKIMSFSPEQQAAIAARCTSGLSL